MSPTLDDLLGTAMTLIRGLRSAGFGEAANDLLAALTAGCSAPELVQYLRAELMGLTEGLPEGLLKEVQSLVEQLTAWLEEEGY